LTTKIEELLREELSSQVDGVHLSGDPFRAALRGYRRRRVITGGVAGVAAVTAGALAAASGVGGSTIGQHGGTVAGPRSQSQSQRPAAVAPKLETVAYVRRHIMQAVDPMHAIVRTFATVGSQTNDNWLDQDTGYITDYTRDHGALTGATKYPQWAAGDVTEVDYRTRTYYVTHQDGGLPLTQTSGKAGEPLLDSVADIKAAIQRADVQLLGHGTFAGRPATHLRFTFRAGGGTVRGDAWFDSQTYAPLRATTTYLSAPATASGVPADGSAGKVSVPGPGAPGSAVPPAPSVSATTSFLPRTAANLAKTRLAIPDGFVRVSPPSK
jgi:hypothetical protein